MYKAFYGLNDNPFSIAPNPHYLFLSDRHREALAHLTYGLGETGGFVLLTGEVGTGKTTVSRCLLKQLPEHTDTAFILNPSLTEQELLATLCDELAISYGDAPSIKQLTDLISQYLLNNHKNGRNTVLIIDEAQHLRPEVLEQLRLLTNLETDTKKLLQVILIGQPELQQLLKRQELRQLAQRITARYHLLPLTVEEIALYVQHRLQVAGRFEPLFSKKACKALHKYSGGIPRLTNLLCERALMAGYGQSKVPIDQHMVKQAAAEVLGEMPVETRSHWPLTIAATLVITFGVSFYGFFPQQVGSEQASALVNKQAVDKVAVIEDVVPVALTQVNRNQSIVRAAMAQSRSIDNAFAGLFALWGKQPIIGLSSCQAATEQGLLCHQQQGNWNSIARLNYPAVVYLEDQQAKQFYGVVVAREGEQVLLQLNEQQLWVSKDWFNRHFSGTFEILWQTDGVMPSEIGQTSSLSQIQWLENNLALVQQRAPRLLNRFDDTLEQDLMAFQRQHGLKSDGIAGNQTLVQLNLYLSKQGPRLTKVGRS
ncbi:MULTISPECIES: ExeA family protein [unclassified Shewanella]|uniref:ExeA family protein n=1 Tax=unclassified Shewanella TaxID=196818 RepID=UPI000C826285|nr:MULTISPECIES: ExeA family protein [unclassified Shewanella]PMG31374.1 AAA family ATPase [Shewanella sp. 10N.286.52.C2]PMG43122.1 AAA family ATPase [Shewanella sp. 10N.286.52.B9]PMH86420.1 AAA family ATPase [Shewanella sp. 10N.286.48.B5]PMI02974.1 AAA family ATPase [Shewanella sp. 10N.286.48.A6]